MELLKYKTLKPDFTASKTNVNFNHFNTETNRYNLCKIEINNNFPPLLTTNANPYFIENFQKIL